MKTSPANTQRCYEISEKDLPVSCPTKEMAVWNSHPRVYLNLKNGFAVCPYCEAEFRLREFHPGFSSHGER